MIPFFLGMIGLVSLLLFGSLHVARGSEESRGMNKGGEMAQLVSQTSESNQTEVVEAAPSSGQFDYASWTERSGGKLGLREWGEYNPSPRRNYFGSGDLNVAQNWHIGLGPLGISTLMLDRTWNSWPGWKEVAPVALCDEDGDMVLSSFLVTHVKPNSPADGVLEVGDYLLAIDDESLHSAATVYLDRDISQRSKRGLEMQTGQLLDLAQGRGSTILSVYRPNPKLEEQAIEAPWIEVASFSPENGVVEIHHRFEEAGLFRVRGEGRQRGLELNFENKRGQRISALVGSGRKGPASAQQSETLPQDWELVGRVNSNQSVQLEYRADVPELSAQFKEQIIQLELELSQVGSFGSHFDPDCDKVTNLSIMLAHRLAVQQEANGSWAAGGYASVKFHTAMCGLALMATGDERYAENVQRAAHFVAFSPTSSPWSYPAGTKLLFLAEYYLRTGDQEIRGALRRSMTDMRRFVASDFTSGHKAGGMGYGGSGYIGAGGPISCGLALACHSDVANKSDVQFYRSMMNRLEEIAPGGVVPYGRTIRNNFKTNATGQAGGCAAGGYYLASLIGGEGAVFSAAAKKRYSTGPFGNSENGHATQTLHFFWSGLASSVSGSEARKAFMDAYLWKFTTLIEYDGFANKNNYALEYHNGDGVIGEPYWRTAGFLILLNTEKQNLAITGNRSFWRQTDSSSAYPGGSGDVTTKNLIFRNWALAEAALGENAPMALTRAIEDLLALPEEEDLAESLSALVADRSMDLAAEVLALPEGAAPVPLGQVAELILGLQVEAWIGNPEGQNDVWQIHLLPRYVGLDEANGEDLSNHPIAPKDFRLEYTMTPGANPILVDTLKGEVATLVDFDPTSDFEIPIDVSYRIRNLEISYQSGLAAGTRSARSHTPSLLRLSLPATPAVDYFGSYAAQLQLTTGRVIGVEHRQGLFPGAMLRGQIYQVELSPSNQRWALDFTDSKELEPLVRRLAWRGEPALNDDDPETTVTIQAGESIRLELDGNQSIYALGYSATGRKASLQFEALVDGDWVLITGNGSKGVRPCVPCETSTLRLVNPSAQGSTGGSTEIQEVSLFSAPELPERMGEVR